MSGFVLARPGDVSEWIRLDSELNKYVTDKDREHVKYTLDKLTTAGVSVKVRTLTAYERARIVGLREAATEPTAILAADQAALASGLVAVRGTDPSGDCTPEMIEAILASHLGWLIAGVVRDYQYVDADKRGAFFTLAPAV